MRKPNPHTLIIDPTDVFDVAGAFASAVFTVSAENANVRTIGLQLKDAQGNNLTARQCVRLILLADANGDAFAVTGGSTGIAIGADGALLAQVAKKSWLAISEVNGHIDLTWTDTGTEVAYLAVILPSGKLAVSAALTNT